MISEMAGISFSVEQFIKQELAEVSDISAVEKQERLTENVKYNSILNGEYGLDLNSPEYDLQNIATECPVTYEQGDIISISKMEEVKPIIIMEKDKNIENVETKMNKARYSARHFEHFDQTKIKSNLLDKENIGYNVNNMKIESMPIESITTKDNLVIKEEKIILDVTHSYSEEPNLKKVQFNLLSKHCDKTVNKNINLKTKSDEHSKTKINKPVNRIVAQEFTAVGSTIPKTGTSNYECPYCGYKCNYEAIFQDHMLSHQNVPFQKYLPFCCDICNFQCRNKQKYELHMKAGHDNNKMLKCFKCNYKNTCANKFKLHLTETGHTVKCPECDLQFDSNIDMKRHLIAHEIKMYECPECKKIMKYNNFKRHLLSHAKPFECKVCGYRAITINRMQSHMLIHTNEKPYECQVCKKTFRQERNLKRHLPSHQNRESRKLYECCVCKKSYTLMQTLKQHYKKSNHGESILPLEK